MSLVHESQNNPAHNSQNQQNVIHYLGIVICGLLSAFGLYQIFTNRIEDGIINLIIGGSLIFSFIPFDYNQAAKWQKVLFIIYTIALLAGIIYVLFKGFTS